MMQKVFLNRLLCCLLLINLVNATKPEIFIITLEKGGGGHMAAAKAILDILKHHYIVHLLPIDKGSTNTLYETVMQHGFLRRIYNAVVRFFWPLYAGLFRIMFWSFKPALVEVLDSSRENIVISVAPFVNGLISDILKEHSPNSEFMVIPTDLEDPLKGLGTPFGSYWFEPNVSNILYLLGSARLMEQADALGITNCKPVSGMIVKKEFTSVLKSKEELRLELGIPADKRVVLFLFGSCGSTEMIQLMKLMHRSDHYCVFICGKSEALKARLDKLNTEHKHTVLGFVDNVAEWMHAADVCIGKPGPGVISECIASKLPLIVKDGLDVMLQERYNIKYIRDNKLGMLVNEWDQLPIKLEELFQDYEIYQSKIAQLPPNEVLTETLTEVLRLHIQILEHSRKS